MIRLVSIGHLTLSFLEMARIDFFYLLIPFPNLSGTYNNQWMVVDFDLLRESPKDLKDGVLTVLEQLPNKIVVEDQTQRLRDTTYWKSYNR